MKNLSKSKILAYRQCEKKLWLAIHKPDQAIYTDSTSGKLTTGDVVGNIARNLYDPNSTGTLIKPFDYDNFNQGFKHALQETQTLLEKQEPIFEAAFSANGGFVMSDILLPASNQQNNTAWNLIEVKSNAKIKDIHIDDIAIQTYIAKSAGVDLQQISIATINNKFVYQGDNNYSELFTQTDVTEQSLEKQKEVQLWFSESQAIAAQVEEPDVRIGPQCTSPYDCAFMEYCSKDLPKAQHPVNWLPRIQAKKLKMYIQEQQVTEMVEVPDDLLNAKQLRVKKHTIDNSVFFDAAGAKKALGDNDRPAYFLDFETTNLAVPLWKGTRPYQQIVFQFSCHKLTEEDELIHTEFLDITGDDPSPQCAEQLIRDCGTVGPIYVYYASFEKGKIRELAQRFPNRSEQLLALNERIVDLLPIASNHFYAPSLQGSWSIKKVLPAVAPDLDYSELEGIKDGSMAMEAFIEAIHSDTSELRQKTIHEQLLKYCELDTYAMVRLWQFFDGQ